MLRKGWRAVRLGVLRQEACPVNYSLASHRICKELDWNTSSLSILSSWVHSETAQVSGFSRACGPVKPEVLTLGSFGGNGCHPHLNHAVIKFPQTESNSAFSIGCVCGAGTVVIGDGEQVGLREKQAGHWDPGLPCPPQASGQMELEEGQATAPPRKVLTSRPTWFRDSWRQDGCVDTAGMWARPIKEPRKMSWVSAQKLSQGDSCVAAGWGGQGLWLIWHHSVQHRQWWSGVSLLEQEKQQGHCVCSGLSYCW